MRLSSALLGVVGATVGVTVGVLGYQTTAASSTPGPGPTVVAPVGRPLPAPPARVTVTMAPCERGAHLVHGVCVTTVHRSIVISDPPPAAPAAAAVAAPAAPPQPARQARQIRSAAQFEADGHDDGRHDDGRHDDGGGGEPSEPADD